HELCWYNETAFDGPAASGRFRLCLPSSSLSNVGETMKKLFVGNLDFGATEDTIRSAFEAFGTVERVSLMTDRDTGRSRGFAFVEMADAGEADRAIQGLNGTNLGGRAINVNEARPKTEGGGGRRDRRW